MSSPEGPVPAARWPWVAYVVFLTIAAVGTVGIVANDESFAEQISYLVAFSTFGLVGALILSRDPRNVVGGMLLWASVITASSFAAGELFTWLHGRDGGSGMLVVLGWINTAGWLYGILPVVFLLPLLFPDGRLPSRRWRPFLWFVLSFIGLLTLWLLFGSAELSGSDQELTVANPLYVSSLGDGFALDPLLAVLYPLLFTLAVLSLVLRFRRADGEQRQQVKWVVFGVVAALIGTIASTALQRAAVISALIGGLSLLAVPVTIGVSVLRYRLYDLDVIVKKALVAATIVLVVVAGYVGLVSLAGVLTTEVGSGVVFVIALGFGIAFRPVTRLARRVADRLVYGRRATPYEVLSEFSGRVGEAYATDDVLGRMAATLGKGVGAERARVWLRVGDELRVASAWPDDGLAVAPLPVLGEALLETGGEDVVEVRDRGELIGALSVVVPANDPMNPGRVKLVRDLAAQAGLALRNVRLVEELRASRRRLVTAQDEERRRLERNIHDGAQQQLVALNVQLGLLAKLTEREPAKARQMAAQLQVRATEALEELRGLARGIYPPLLADRGLGAALEAQARRATVPVKVDVAFDRRYPSEIEAAVYFSCLEGLQNVAKYAEATSVELRAGAEDGWLVFEVVDDGRGFDPSANGFGTGLQGIADRLGAIGGGIEVVSAPGRGTTIRGRVPTSASLRDQVPIGEG